MYEVEITAEGLRHLNRLPDKVRDAALESILGPIADNPQQLGKPLVGHLEGLWSARRGDYRIIYEILEDDEIVLVHRVQHRRDVYRSPRASPSEIRGLDATGSTSLSEQGRSSPARSEWQVVSATCRGSGPG